MQLTKSSVLVLMCCAAAGAACACNAKAGTNDPHGRVDYGTRCAHWDAPDERPWCSVDKDACGPDTFEGNKGHFWSHTPCGGKGDPYRATVSNVSAGQGQAQLRGSAGSGARKSPLSERIPKVIMQTGYEAQSVSSSTEKWASKNPEYVSAYFGNEACVEFLKEHFDTRVLAAFNALRPGAYKADLFRYAYIYVMGGVYADLDTVPYASLEKILEPAVDFVVVAERNDLPGGGIPGAWQGIMAGVPKLPFLKRAIDQVVWRVENRWIPPNTDVNDWVGILNITGPVALAHAMGQVHTNGPHTVDGHPVWLWQHAKGGKVIDHRSGESLASTDGARYNKKASVSYAGAYPGGVYHKK